MANQFGNTGPVSGLKTQEQRQAEAEGYEVEDRKPTKITVQFHTGTGKWTATLDRNGGHTFSFNSSRAVKRFINDIYEAQGLGRNVEWLDDEPRPEPPVAVAGYAQVFPHPHGFYFCVSVYSDLKASEYLHGQDYSGTVHSLADALTYVSNVVIARNLKRMSVDIRASNEPIEPQAGEIVPGWTTEELLRREG